MTEVGTNYGGALYALARDEGLAGQLHKELSVLMESFAAEPAFCALLSSATLTKAERCQVLEDSFRDRVHPYVLNFMKLLTEKGYIRHFSDCVRAYTDSYYADEGILCVSAVTAVPLTQEQQQRLTAKLQQITGKRILLSCRIDAAVLGGIRLDYQGKRLDDTLAHRLDAIRELLTKTVL